MVEITSAPVAGKRVERAHFGENSTAGIMVHEITKGVFVAPG